MEMLNLGNMQWKRSEGTLVSSRGASEVFVHFEAILHFSWNFLIKHNIGFYIALYIKTQVFDIIFSM
jgi:hypothetical protein